MFFISLILSYCSEKNNVNIDVNLVLIPILLISTDLDIYFKNINQTFTHLKQISLKDKKPNNISHLAFYNTTLNLQFNRQKYLQTIQKINSVHHHQVK